MPDRGLRPSEPFLYDAFISYRHVDRDRKWAEWLIAALEGYRVPRSLQDRGLPPRLRKIFRDEDEVPASADLNDQIKQALIASRYLIVVCSAFTPRSKWVEREIQMFNELGRDDQVLALLTEGEPGDSFPAPMLERHRVVTDPDGGTRIVKEDKEPLAADVRPRAGVSARQQKRIALLRLVAVILGVKFDDLRQRDNERARKARVTWGALAAVLCLLVTGGAATYWQMMQPKVTDYRQIIWRWGLPQGLGSIDAETRSHLETHYSVTMRRAGIFESPRVVEVRRENSSGSLRADTDGHAHWLIHYGAGKFTAVSESFDANGRPARETHLERGSSANTLVESYKRDTADLAQAVRITIGEQGFNVRTDITRTELTLDDRGFAIRSRYQNHYGDPQHNADGSYGWNVTYSSDGLVFRRAEVGVDSNEITLKNGIRETAYLYDSYNMRSQTSIGADNRPFDGPDGYAQQLFEYDRWGNLIARQYIGADGRPVSIKPGIAKVIYTYDARGNEVEAVNLDLNDRPALGTYGNAGAKRVFDERGNKIEETNIGLDGRPSLSKEGIAKVRYKYDPNDRETARSFFGTNDEPVVIVNGYASYSRKYDDRGNITASAYFGPDGNPISTKDGYAKRTHSYNARGQEVRQADFGVDDKLTLNTDGYAIATYGYDQRGNQNRISFYGIDEKPALFKQFAVAGWQITYDQRGIMAGIEWLGTDGGPTLGLLGIAGSTYIHDDRGNQTESAFVGLDKGRALNRLGYAGYRQKFDARGNATEKEYFGVDGRAVVTTRGYAKSVHTFDSRNNETEVAYYLPDGTRALYADLANIGVGGYAGYRQRFDDRGNKIEMVYLGLDGKAVLSSEGLAKIKYEFNPRGQEVRRAFFDTNDRPTLGLLGYAGFRQEFGGLGKRTKLAYFGAGDRPILFKDGYAGFRETYDARGNFSETSYFGLNDESVLTRDGLATIRYVFNARDQEIKRAYFDASGKPTLGTLGYAGFRQNFDARGNILEQNYFGVDGEPIPSGLGYARVMYAYDNLGRESEATYFDAQNRQLKVDMIVLSVNPGGIAERIGLASGDRVLSYDGRKTTSTSQFVNAVDDVSGRQSRALIVRRGTDELKFEIAPGRLGINIRMVLAAPE